MSNEILKELPQQNQESPYQWSGAFAVPAIGERVTISFNELGAGEVLGYNLSPGRDGGWLGVWVKLDKNPAWRERAGYGIEVPALVYGAEILEQRATS